MKLQFRPVAYLSAAVGALILLSGCAEASTEIDRTPHQIETALSSVNKEGMWLPVPYLESNIVDPQWATDPQWAGEIFFGARETTEALQFFALDVYGNELWHVERPLACSGFTVSEDEEGNAIVVLLDIETSGNEFENPTASAFDITSGELRWGPVEVPGPHQGPGLVFAAAPAGYMGDLGPKVALDPTNGELFATEEADIDSTLIGEYNGTLLTVQDGKLLAQDMASDRELWQTDISRFAGSESKFSPAPGKDPVAGFAFVQNSPDSALLVDLETGNIVAETLQEVGLDPHSDTLVYIDDHGLHARNAQDLEAAPLWSVSVTPGIKIAGVGGVFVYLIEGDSVRVHNVLTGDIVSVYDSQDSGRILVPRYVTPTGAAILLDGNEHLVAIISEFYE